MAADLRSSDSVIGEFFQLKGREVLRVVLLVLFLSCGVSGATESVVVLCACYNN